jgi:DNA-directed RNA polymerase specialized sigma24 family protein
MMIEVLDLTKHSGFINKIIRGWKIPEQEQEDAYQDFCVYFYSYAKYDRAKGKPTTFIAHVFKNFLYDKNYKIDKQRALQEAIHIEERDADFLDRELGCDASDMEIGIYIEQLLEGLDDVTISLLMGESSAEQARTEGVSRQHVNKRHLEIMSKIRGK